MREFRILVQNRGETGELRISTECVKQGRMETGRDHLEGRHVRVGQVLDRYDRVDLCKTGWISLLILEWQEAVQPTGSRTQGGFCVCVCVWCVWQIGNIGHRIGPKSSHPP